VKRSRSGRVTISGENSPGFSTVGWETELSAVPLEKREMRGPREGSGGDCCMLGGLVSAPIRLANVDRGVEGSILSTTGTSCKR
jgi:hypothetical protein